MLPHWTTVHDDSRVCMSNFKPGALYLFFVLSLVASVLLLVWPMKPSMTNLHVEIQTCVAIVLFLCGNVGLFTKHQYEVPFVQTLALACGLQQCKFWFESGNYTSHINEDMQEDARLRAFRSELSLPALGIGMYRERWALSRKTFVHGAVSSQTPVDREPSLDRQTVNEVGQKHMCPN